MIKELNKNDEKEFCELEKTFSYVIKNIDNELQNNPFTNYIIYIKDNNIVGFINYYLIYDKVEIANFNVLGEFQNKGIGTALLKYLIEKYQGLVDNITLEVSLNNKKAIKLYEKMNFKKVAIRKNYYQGIDGFLMERSMVK